MEDQPVVVRKGEEERDRGRRSDKTHQFAVAGKQWKRQSYQQIPLKLDGQRPVRHVDPRHVNQIVQVAEMQQQVASSHGHVGDVEHRYQNEICRQDGDCDRRQIRRIQAHIALQQKLGVIAQNVLRAIEAPGNYKSRDDKKNVNAQVAVFSRHPNVLSLSCHEVAPGHGKRCECTERIDDANALLGVGYLHFTVMLNGRLYTPSITEECEERSLLPPVSPKRLWRQISRRPKR